MRQNSQLVIFLIAFLDIVGFGMLLPILPFATRDLGGTLASYGALMVAYTGVQFVVSPVWGRVSDSWGRRPVILLNLVGTVVAFALLGLAGNLRWFFIARALAGLFGGTLSTAYAYVFDSAYNAADRAKGFGMIGMASALGLVFGPAIGGTLYRYGLDIPVVLAMSMSLFNLVFAFFLLGEQRMPRSARAANRFKRFDWSAWELVFENPQARLGSLCFMLFTLTLSQVECVLVIYLWSRFQFDAEVSGVILATMNVIVFGLQNRWQPRLVRTRGLPAAVATGALLVSVSLLLVVNAPWGWLLTAALFAMAMGQGLVTPSLAGWAAETLPAERRVLAMGVYRSFGSVARIVGPLTAGWLFEHISWRSPFISGLALSGFVGISALAWIGFRPRTQIPLDSPSV